MMFAPDPAAGASPADLELGSSYGVMLLSTIIVAAMFGFTVLQTLYYYEQFPKDPLILKLSVAALTIMDLMTMIFNSHAVYFYLIDNYANPPALQKEIWSAQAELLVTYTIVLVVQLFFIFRIYHLRPHMWYIPVILGVISFASFFMVVVIFSRVVHDDTWAATNRPEVTQPLTANWVLGNIVDIGITVILCWYLWSEKLAVREKTNIMLNRIIVFLVNRGAIAAVVQVLTLLTKFIWPQTLVWLAFHNALSKVYVNSMLATLNARVALRKIIMDSELDQERPPTEFSQRGPSRPVSKVPPLAVARPMPDGHQIATLQFARQPTGATVYDTRSGASFDMRSGSVSDARSVPSRTGTVTDVSDYYQRPATGMSSYTARTAMTQRTLRDDGSPQDPYAYNKV
ncbi:hypothetical protein C8Q76DRAFT_797251 [Earliella scabrosa]|nr:hypothetical protein C8Q76DRAFT_797251 [Earliella scabrosa]